MTPTQRVGVWFSAPRWGLLWALGFILGAWSLSAAESQLSTEPAAASPTVANDGQAPGEAEAPVNAPPPVVIPPEIATAVDELNADEFSVRQQAEKRLIALGAPAFEPLLAVLEQSKSEAGRRILLILERIWLQTPQPLADELERQLDRLSFSLSPFQAEVDQMLQSHHRLREERASRKLRQLNAIIEKVVDENARDLLIKFGSMDHQPQERIASVIFPRSWKGTSEDLWHLRRLSHTDVLSVFVVRGNGITEEEKQAMRLGFPELSVSERSEVFIGVMGQPIAFDTRVGCSVTGVQPDSPASTAGIQVGDLIQKVDGVMIRSFEDLVEQLKSKRGYQPIEMTIEHSPAVDPTLITVIGLPWEVRRFPVPPPPPLAESLIDLPNFRRGRPRPLQN